MRAVDAVLILMVLAGCASEAVVKASGPRSVTVSRLFSNDAKAQEAAETECQKHELHAQVKQNDNHGHIIYDCVP
jgi:hypothetical protein